MQRRNGRSISQLVFSITSQDDSMAMTTISLTPKDIGIQRERSQSSH